MRYKHVPFYDGVMRIDENGMACVVPPDITNRDWVTYQDWLAEGNEPEPADEV